MEITNDFLNELDDIFEVELGTIKPSTTFKDLDEWDSVTLLSLVAVFEEEYGVVLSNDIIDKSDTILELVENSMNS
jgi:acyl carrier protein